MTVNPVIKVAAYCRVSTDGADQSNSFELQQRYFRSFIGEKEDWELYEIYADEGITGTSTKRRTEFNRMIRDAYAGQFSLILTKEVSRFSRNILDTISYTRELRNLGVGVYFVTDRIYTLDPESEMVLSFLASMAQEESRKTSARVTWGQTRQMERGIVFGPSLLGYRVKNGILTVNREEAWLVRLIFHKYAVEGLGIGEIARFLTQEGCRTHSGGTRWYPGTVIKILKNEKYVGDLIQKKSYTPDYLTHEKKKNRGEVPVICHKNHHEPIISRELWIMTQERMEKNRKNQDCGCGHSDRYVFSGKIRCGECGSVFVSRIKYLDDGRQIRRWSCRRAVYGGTNACNIGKLVRDDDGLWMLKSAIERLRINADDLSQSVMELISHSEAPEYTEIRQNLERLEQKRQRMLDSFFADEISKTDMLLLKDQYDAQLSSFRRHMMPTDDSKSQKMSLDSEIAAILTGSVESEIFYKALLDHLTVFKDGSVELHFKKLPYVFRFIYG